MAKYNDSEELRFIDRIRAVAYKEAKDEGAGFITKLWIAKKLNRSEKFVQRNWTKKYEECSTDFSDCGREEILSQESKDIIEANMKKKTRSLAVITAEIIEKRAKPSLARNTVRNYLLYTGAKPFHEVACCLKTEKNREDRLWFANFLSDWGEEDFLNLAPSDECFVYTIRKPNFQNDRIWARSKSEIP